MNIGYSRADQPFQQGTKKILPEGSTFSITNVNPDAMLCESRLSIPSFLFPSARFFPSFGALAPLSDTKMHRNGQGGGGISLTFPGLSTNGPYSSISPAGNRSNDLPMM